jgi:tRNA (adenine57-N1/adenine58-N1)-methyltransferase
MLTLVENDVVLLKAKSNDKALAILTKRLLPGGRIRLEGSREHIAVDDIIGKSVRDLVATHRGTEYRILQPSLAEYVDLSPRIVTPVSRHHVEHVSALRSLTTYQ